MLEHIQKLTQIKFLRGENLTNDISCLMFVLFLSVSQCLFVKMIDNQIEATTNEVQNIEPQNDLIDF